jgi:hypothetical protein
MTAWDVLNRLITGLPLLGGVIAFLVILGVFIMVAIGFGKYGVNFLKYGFKQSRVGDITAKIDDLRAELETIKTNHFSHLKDFLTELTGIMVDRNVFTNADKARLDNHLRGM